MENKNNFGDKMKFVTKDSGKRETYKSGMNRDLQDGKPRYDLIWEPILTRFANLLERGAKKYDENNWKMANSIEELNRFKASGLRHMIQWKNETEHTEDHAVAVMFNIMCAEYLKEKLGVDINGRRWEICADANNYEVSDYGEVRRIKDKYIMSQWDNTWGYKMVSLSGADRKNFQVHRLVMRAFVGESDLQVNHIDGIKSNNILSNLEYVTQSENIQHGWDTGLYTSKASCAKITYKDAEIIRLRVDAGEKQKDLANEFGISPQTINDIVKYRIWQKYIKTISEE